ncbi:MAG: GreA/GreB family elongation factor, partial [Novosphingobium sp.]
RRDSDEEHLEPWFEIPLPPGPNLVTAQGLERIAARVAELEAVLPTITDADARKATIRDLRYWRARLATADVRPVPTGDKVQFGSRVSYRLNEKDQAITIVGHDEADPAKHMVSFLAPLCRAMLGAKVGDLVDFGGREEAIEIIDVGAPSSSDLISPS